MQLCQQRWLRLLQHSESTSDRCMVSRSASTCDRRITFQRPSCKYFAALGRESSGRMHRTAAAVAAPGAEQTEAGLMVERANQHDALSENPVSIPKLAALQMQPIINTKGYIMPEVVPGALAAVFAVHDQHQKLQYIGFSKDLKASLKTVLGRRPDKAFFFKAVQLPVIDQEAMMEIRQAWFDECGAPPTGNKLALERRAWQSAVDAGAISARAKPAAAAEKAKELQAMLLQRGCKEEFIPDPELLANGQVDFLVSSSNQQQQQGSATQDAATASDATDQSSTNTVRTATVVVDGQGKQFSVEYLMKYPTKGGYMMDVRLSFDFMDSQHRIIVGKAYYEPYNIAPELAVETCLALMLAQKRPRHNEGMLGTAEFPINYFTASEMEQWFGDEFAAHFEHITGHELKDNMASFWRMNKIHDYGAKLENPASLGAALAKKGLGKMEP